MLRCGYQAHFEGFLIVFGALSGYLQVFLFDNIVFEAYSLLMILDYISLLVNNSVFGEANRITFRKLCFCGAKFSSKFFNLPGCFKRDYDSGVT